MITALEASATGCLVGKNGTTYTNIMGNSINAYNYGSCPDFMHNYLYESTLYGGSNSNDTKNEKELEDYGYWTISAHSANSTGAWLVWRYGILASDVSSMASCGARAVVEITKSNL